MARGSRSAANKESQSAFRSFIQSPALQYDVARYLQDPTPQLQEHILKSAPTYLHFDGTRSWSAFVNVGLRVADPNSDVRSLFERLRDLLWEDRKPTATHQKKRKIVNALGINRRPFSIRDLIERHGSFQGAQDYLQKELGITLILRKRVDASTHGFKRYHPLVEVQNDDTGPQAYVCDEEHGFYIVHTDVSAIFVSPSNECGEYPLELVVIRKVPVDTPGGASILEAMTNTILEACAHRKDVRPNHDGTMVQIGWNMGARTVPRSSSAAGKQKRPVWAPQCARILGYATSFTKRLADDEKTRQDRSLIGALSVLWALILAYVPLDITEPVRASLDSEYPPLATAHVPLGSGYQIELDDMILDFSTASRAPPEGIATAGYVAWSHTDATWLKWCFGWTVARFVPDDFDLPDDKGSSFVDMELKVVVRPAAATLSVFKPDGLHGTTESHGSVNHGLLIPFTRRVRDGYLEFVKHGDGVQYGIPVDEYHGPR